MSDINVNQVLTQMRSLATQANEQMHDGEGHTDFSALLKQAVDSVNEKEQIAGHLSEAFEVGAKNVSLAEVMIAGQKANVSFQALVQVRNKLVDAYQDVMNMPM